MVAEHEIRIMAATDAACQGLNLQTLGTLINVNLPWNPTRLEQRIGRIKRFGQVREKVDMLKWLASRPSTRRFMSALGADARPLRPLRLAAGYYQG